MNIYTTRQDGFPEIRKQILLKGIPTWLLSLGVGLWLSFYNSGGTSEQEMSILPVFIPFIMAVVGFGVYRSLKQQKQLYESYTLTISDDQIKREQFNTPTIIVPISDITAVTRNHNGTFTIKGTSTNNTIGVYKQMAQYDALEAQLNEVYPVTIQATEPVLQKLRLPILLLTLGLMAVVYMSSNKVHVGACGIALTGFMIWTFFYLQQSPHFDRTTKRTRWWLILVVFSIIARTMSTLLN